MRYALLNPWRCRGRRCVTAADSRPTMATATGGGGGGAKLRRLRDACACLRGPVSSVSQAALRDVMAVLGASPPCGSCQPPPPGALTPVCVPVARSADTITAEDLCLDREALSGPPKGGGGFLSRLTGGSTNRVTFVPVHEDECYTVGVFALAQGSTIPLHDHPGAERRRRAPLTPSVLAVLRCAPSLRRHGGALKTALRRLARQEF